VLRRYPASRYPRGVSERRGRDKLLAEGGVWLSLQPVFEDEDAILTAPGSDNEAKYK
jgi:hypothetical protein